jgi:hypothetical protein
MKHTNLKMFQKNEKEGAFHWRDININNDLTSLESKMLVRFANSLIGIITIPLLNTILILHTESTLYVRSYSLSSFDRYLP